MSEIVLEARGVCLDYGGGVRATRALRQATLTIRRGEFVGIMGPSGSGKSSLLYLLAGLRRPTSGEALFRGEPWPFSIDRGASRRRSSLGLVFQEPFLIPHWTIAENIRIRRKAVPANAVESVAEALGIAHLLDEFPDRLSTGERQRASVARALVHDPVAVLADEPTSSLDTENGRGVMQALARSAKDAALVICSHDRRMLSGANRIYYLDDGVLSAGPAGAPS